ncbi:MAG TPA: hypothetical protein PJ991_05935 [Kiritimatiellia bacterium]|nr:hypothetical protein [Kiritimatiellia bacterium]
MHRILKLLCLGLMVFVLAGWSQASEIKIVALNIEWFPGQRMRPSSHEVERHIADTREALGELAPDILIATEICEEAAFRDVLGAVPGLDLHVISNFRFSEDDSEDRRNQQIAIASRLNAYAAWAEPWEVTMDNLRRGFAFTALENPETGRLILVYGLHLKSNKSSSPEEDQQNFNIRDESIRQLLDHMARMEEQFADIGIDAWIVGGDVNTNDDGQFGDNVIRMMVDAGYWNSWANTPREERLTWKARGPFSTTTFDYIFTKGLGEMDAQLVLTDDSVSDHNAVVLYVDLPSAIAPEIETPADLEAVIDADASEEVAEPTPSEVGQD